MEALPEALQRLQASLEPYIKKREDVSKIRRVLSSHMASQLNSTSGLSMNRPLSLLEAHCQVEPSVHGVRGLQKDYLRCVRANLKARTEYALVSNEHRTDTAEGDLSDKSQQSGLSNGMDVFIQLTTQQQKHERLCIIQDYIEAMMQKPAAATEHLDPKDVLRDVESLPKVPSEVLSSTSAGSKGQVIDLQALVDRLEKSVLRAKLLLKKEQNLLARLISENQILESQSNRLQALGLTRNELINWIEGEMEKAGDGPPEAEGEEQSSRDVRGKDYIDSQLASIQRQYTRYTEARQALVTSASAISSSATSMSEETSRLPDLADEFQQFGNMQTIYPYLDKMVFVANQQKAAIQQRSYLTISLAKQVKEAGQGLDRLAEESHLLPAHPIPTSILQRKGLESPLSFNDELLQHEKPNSLNRASAWTFAAGSSSHVVRNAVTEQLGTGGTALVESQNSLSKICHLLGYESSISGTESQKRNIWSVLDGSLGVINSDELK